MPLDSPILRDGDMGFLGYSSRLNPSTLPAGMLQESQNMRLDRGVAVTRKGVKRMADNISIASTPLTLPFILNTVPEPVVQSSYDGGIFASCVMRSPDDTNSSEIVVLAGPDRAYTFPLDGTTQFSAAWSSDVICDNTLDNIVTSAGDEILAALLPTDLPYPSTPVDETVSPTDRVSMLQAFDRLYLLREADSGQSGWGVVYTNNSGITVSTTTATVNVTGHGYLVGMRVRISGSASAAFDGHEYDITAKTADTFSVAVPSGTTADASPNIAVRRVKPPLYWDGNPANDFVRTEAGIPNVGITFRRMRSAGWAEYINNRLIVPDGRQNVLLSDVFDPDTFDWFWQSFRVGAGGHDKIVAIHPWVEGTFLIFCRKSIWLATVGQTANAGGTAFAVDTAVSNLTMLTGEIGCSARRSIATAGQFIYFLSDSGVYRLDSRLDLKLRGDTNPLSAPISDQLSNLNATLVEDSVGLYFDNRYYLAVPLAGADNNNGVFIYNQLNEQWETRDIYGFGVGNFLVTDVEGRRRVLISNVAGKLMMLDEIEAGDQSASSSVNITSAVPGRIVTRRYGMGTMTSKRFLRAISDVELPNTATIGVNATLHNPDSVLTLLPSQTNSSGSPEDYTLKQPIRGRAHYAELEFVTSANRPQIRSVSIEAAEHGLPATETRNIA